MKARWTSVLLRALAAASIPVALAIIDDLVDNGRLDGTAAERVRRVVRVVRGFV